MSDFHLTAAISALTDELCAALEHYTAALTRTCAPCIADVSECSRRSASLAADTHAALFSAFCPPLPRMPSVAFCEALHGAIEAVFGASMLLSASYRPSARLDTVAQGIVRMGEMIRHEVSGLAHLVKGRGFSAPDTYAYHAELMRTRAALALDRMHGERSELERLVAAGMAEVIEALAATYAAWLALFAEAI